MYNEKMNLRTIFKDKQERQAYSYILSLTIPMIIQNLFNSAVNSADVLMLNFVGQDAISAVSLATQYSNILINIYMGLGSGVAMLCSQYCTIYHLFGGLPLFSRYQTSAWICF